MNAPGKIIFSFPGLKEPSHPKSTGGTISNYRLVEVSAERLSVVLAGNRSNIFVTDLLEKVKVWSVKSSPEKAGSFRYSKALKSEIESHKVRGCDVIVSSGINIIGSSWAARNMGCRHIVLIRSLDYVPYSKTIKSKISLKKKIKNLVRDTLIYRSLLKADAIVTNSQWMARNISKVLGLQYPSNKISVLYPPLDLVCRNSPVVAEPESGSRNIGFINRGSNKGHDLILDLAHNMPNFNFYIYGDMDPLKNVFLPENVDLRGFSAREEIYTEINLLLVPSRVPEAFGRVVLEAQANRVPVLVAQSGGMPEVVASPEWVVSTYQSCDWEKRIKDILSSDNACKETLDSWLQLNSIKFSLEEHASSWFKIIDKTVNA